MLFYHAVCHLSNEFVKFVSVLDKFIVEMFLRVCYNMLRIKKYLYERTLIMKLGVLTNVYRDLPFEEALKKFKALGIEMIEVGCGGYPGSDHCNPDVLLSDEQALADWRALVDKYGFEISALSVHGNPVHPDPAEAASYHAQFEKAVLLAEKLGIDTVVTFSGCPGGSPDDRMPNWVTCTWPNEYKAVLDYQWNEVLIPYWRKAVAFANAHGVTKIALELHPGFCVYNVSTLLRLREAVGETIGANFDPSHLIWQGGDIIAAIRALRGAIYHFHAKDTKIDKYNTAVNGVLDTGSYANAYKRSWKFRTVGYGNGEDFWRDVISTLHILGYNGSISIEHEDCLMSLDEGLTKAAKFLDGIIIRDPMPQSIAWE